MSWMNNAFTTSRHDDTKTSRDGRYFEIGLLVVGSVVDLGSHGVGALLDAVLGLDS